MTNETDLHDIFGGDVSTEGVDATQAGGGTSEVFETGVYEFMVERAELKDTNAKDGSKLVSVMFRQVDANAVLWQNYNVKNKSDRAEEIAKRELKKLAVGCGFDAIPRSPSDFVDKVCVLALKKAETRDSKKARQRKPDIVPVFENTITSYAADAGDKTAAPDGAGNKGQQPNLSNVNL